MRRLNTFLDSLPLGIYGLLAGLIVFAADAAVFLATGKSTGTAMETGLAGGIGGGIGSALSRDRRVQWRKNLKQRFAKPSKQSHP